MTPTDPLETHRLFQHDRVAIGYASARPYLHPEVFARVREIVQLLPLFGSEPRRVAFGGYIQALRRR